MNPFNEEMKEYRTQMEKGVIQKAYKGLMEYIMELRLYFKNTYPEYSISSMYYGYMDMSYFAIVPKALKLRKLKVALVFIHNTCEFEAWLSGNNRQVQAKYWKLVKESSWNKYRIPLDLKGRDSIIEYTLAENPDFSDLKSLRKQIEKGTSDFIEDIEQFLLKY